MEYYVQIVIYCVFICFVWLLRLVIQGIAGHKLRKKERNEDKDYLHSQKTVELLLNEFAGRPTLFEHYIAEVFKSAGFEQVEVTAAVNDGGKDVVMYKNNQKYVAEVKLYQPQYKISRERIQKLHSAMLDSGAEHACFVTTSDYTGNAKVYAGKHGIDLINGYLLGRFVHLLEEEDEKGRNQLMFLHEMQNADREQNRQVIRAGAWRLQGFLFILYPLYTVLYLYFIIDADTVLILLFIFLNAINLRQIVSCLIKSKWKKHCEETIKSV